MLKDLSKYKVLVVDDIPANILLLKVMLEQSKLQVFTAGSSTEAYTQLNKEPVDLILLDILMPGVNGFELAEQLKNNPVYQDIPIIFLTALNATSDIIKGFGLGADDFISKPFNKEELLVRVRYQLTLLEAKRTIQQQTIELKNTISGRDKLYSVIAHDLRMPMSSLKMSLNILTMKTGEFNAIDPDIVEILQNANELSEKLFTLLDNLLKWTRSQFGGLVAFPQDINLSELTEGVIEVSAMIAANKHIKLNFISANSEETDVFVDIDMIKTAIRNLLSNAIKFSHSGSEVDVVIKREKNEVLLSVEDHGCGISEEAQRKLMNVETHYTTYGTENESGSGLGLLLVNEFMKLNQGRLFFKSKEGEGSTFGFALPVKEAQR
ncbi:MAG: hybrid sensor histidine kinase/response regulator [Porphyromonadaceae bacterium]|nr:hybrid sensor histidine kinase/response regulator [Porphyromonadaceae bacterium]